MVLVSVRLITYMSHGGRVEGVRMIVVALGCDVGGDERCKDGGHLLMMVVEYLLEGLVVPPCGRMIAVHVGVSDGSCMELEGVQQVVGELYDGAEKGCTVEVMLNLKWAADVPNVHVYGGRVRLVGKVG